MLSEATRPGRSDTALTILRTLRCAALGAASALGDVSWADWVLPGRSCPPQVCDWASTPVLSRTLISRGGDCSITQSGTSGRPEHLSLRHPLDTQVRSSSQTLGSAGRAGNILTCLGLGKFGVL